MTNIDIYQNINLHGNKVSDAVIEPLEAAPSADVLTGRAYFDTALNALRIRRASDWTSLEMLASRVTTVSSVSTNDTYPTAKAVYDYITAVETTLNDNIANVNTTLNSHIANTSNPHSVTKAQVGLGNCDNTSDANKPVSTATQTALDGKAPTSHASSATTYGIGTTSLYGHVRLVEALTTSAATNGLALGAYQGFLLNQTIGTNDSAALHKAGAETATGAKTFSALVTANAGMNITGNVVINGNITQNGSQYITHAEEVTTTNDYIVMRYGATAGLTSGNYAGFQVVKYDGTNDGRLVIDNAGTARVGDVGNEQPLLTRLESGSMTANGLLWWNGTTFAANTVGVGTSGQFLRSTGAVPSWASLQSGDIPDLSASYLAVGTSTASIAQTVYGVKTFNSTIVGSISGNAATATTATTATKLSNTSAIGSATVPVYFTAGGVPAVCTSISLNAATATSLATARTIQVALDSTASASFNGTANVTPGVSGILGVANGGTGNSSVDTAPTSGSTKMVTSGGVYTAIVNAIGATKYAASITGDGTTTSWTLIHGLGTTDVIIMVYDSTGNMIMCGAQAASTTTAVISITPAPASTSTFRVVIKK